MVNESNDNLRAGKSLGHYRILKQIGAGGMGEVYLAEDIKLDRRVALKILPSEFAEDKDRMNRFVREAKSASALNHPNIITIHEIGESGGTHFIATEFIEGETLQKHLKGENFSLKTVLDIATQIASALQTAHSAGIVHRDIKPDNVMIRADGLAKILDFGIAKLSEPTATAGGLNLSEEDATAIKPQSTSPGMIIGTANYMSPEQAKGKDIDARSDIFSFGIVFYEMLTGKLPFTGETALESISSILKDEPQPLHQILPDIPSEIERIAGKTLRKDREERYQTAKDLLIDLKDAKHDLEFQNKLERSIVPNKDENKTQILKATASGEINRTTTNQTLASNPTKKYLAAGLLTLILAVGGFFGYKYFSPTNKQIESIAVMPFVNESGNVDVEYLSDGMTETLISSLSQIPKLNVKARSSVFRYKGKETDAPTIGKELNVQAILNGRVVLRGDDLVLYLELVDTQTGNRIWGDQYNKKLTNLVSLQNEIARDVSLKLKTKLSGADEQRLAKNYTANAEAYRLYLLGRFHWSKRTESDFRKAIEYFQQAIIADPNYALAYALLADTYMMLSASQYGGEPPLEAIPKARETALKALSLDDQLAEAHTALGFILAQSYDHPGAEREYKKALELDPNDATAHQRYGYLLTYYERHEEGLAEIRRALELEPLSLPINRSYGDLLFYARRYDESIAQYKKTLALDANWTSASQGLASAYWMKGDYAARVEAFAKYREAQGRKADAALVRESFSKGGWEAFLRLRIEELRNPTINPYADYALATYLAALGEKDEAFAALNRAYENQEYGLLLIKTDPRLDPLRDDPRFQELLRKVGFPQ